MRKAEKNSDYWQQLLTPPNSSARIWKEATIARKGELGLFAEKLRRPIDGSAQA
jgi:hypothetical protein